MNEDKLLPSLKSTQEELEQSLLEEDNIDNIKSIIDIFNVNIKKKDIIRASKLNELQDKIYEQINERLVTNANDFSNRDLLDYFRTIQETINKSEINSDDVVTPKIQLNQNNLNINMGPTLNRDSRQNVLDAVKKILENQVELEDKNIIDE